MKIKSWQVWTGLAVAAAAAYYIYQNDSTPPVISNFKISATELNVSTGAQSLSFSGSITEDRDLKQADLICVSNGEKRMIIHLGIKGASANFLSFAVLPGSPSWTGRWVGSLTNLSFEGKGSLPKAMRETNCTWEARLTDAIGNQNNDQLGVSMKISSK